MNFVDVFCNSNSLDIYELARNYGYKNTVIVDIANEILEDMYDGIINTTHSFYLKLFHIMLMVGTIKPKEIDLLIVDEANDLSAIALDIFNKYPAKQKVVIGDTYQSIYSFLGLVSAFEYYKNKGLHLSLTKSFRVNQFDAEMVEAFGKEYLSKSFKFKGMEYTKEEYKTKAILVRSNSDLITNIIRLNISNIPFKLVTKTKAYSLFEYPLFLAYLRKGNKGHKSLELRHIQEDVDEYYTLIASNKLSSKEVSLYSYLKDKNPNNNSLHSAINLMINFSKNDIIEAYKTIEQHINSNANLILSTVHAFKGLTVDVTELSSSVNNSLLRALAKIEENGMTVELQEELNLFYVAITRHRHRLEGLDDDIKELLSYLYNKHL